MLSPYQAKRLHALINRHAAAETDKVWSGSYDLADRKAAHQEAKAAKKVLAAYIRSLTRSADPERPNVQN